VLTRLDHAAGTPVAVGQLGRDRQLAPPAHAHAGHALVPAGDDATGAEALTAVRAVLDPVEGELWDEADALVDRSPDEQVRWARTLWPRLDATLDLLGV
jgi:hypothetical protein